MQLEAQTFLRLVEGAGTLACVDIEAVGLRGDYNSVLVVSFKPYGQEPYSLVVDRPGEDGKVVRAAKRELEKYDCWVTYFGKGFDIKMLNTRLLRHGSHPIAKRPHLDLYFSLKANLLTARKSQGHLLSWLRAGEEKMGVSADVWSEIIAQPKKHMPTMIERCESDCTGLESLYKRTKHIVVDITR